MPEDKVGENLFNEELLPYHLEELDNIYKGLGRLEKIVSALQEASVELQAIYPQDGQAVFESLQSLVKTGRESVKNLALELDRRSKEEK